MGLLQDRGVIAPFQRDDLFHLCDGLFDAAQRDDNVGSIAQFVDCYEKMRTLLVVLAGLVDHGMDSPPR
jgi:hypothetical protein